MKPRLIIGVLLLVTIAGALELTGLAAPTRSAEAQGSAYNLTWSTVDDGGGMSTGGAYTLNGTIGQPDAGASNGGAYSHSGGFWSTLAARIVESGAKLYLPFIRK